VEAIVNAANETGLGCHIPGHCVDSAIHAAAGPKLLAACEALGGIPTAVAKITNAFNVPCKHIIHVTGPRAEITSKEEEEGAEKKFDFEALAASYRACMDIAAKNNIRQIAFCSISTGQFGFPREASARTAVSTIRLWLAQHSRGSQGSQGQTGYQGAVNTEVIFCVSNYEDLSNYQTYITSPFL
jgi:O-acetyl-ADP-ribose deacetylase (regulator of RNase III)